MATNHKYVCDAKYWTYGAEFELDDWPRRDKLPDGLQIDPDWSMVNSNGVAVDGPAELYHLGGEILARPCDHPTGLAHQMAAIMNKWPQTRVNHRTGVHIHIRVPGLRDDLTKLKQLQKYINEWMPKLLPLIEPIPIPTAGAYTGKEELKGAMRNYRKWKEQHHYFVPQDRVRIQMQARTPKEFFEAEAIHIPTGKVYWATKPRACVNLRQLLQTDTIEFRHFPGSCSPYEVDSAAIWCDSFLRAAFDNAEIDPDKFAREAGPLDGRPWPQFPRYEHWLEIGYRFTSRHYHKADKVIAHIREWLSTRRPVVLEDEWP